MNPYVMLAILMLIGAAGLAIYHLGRRAGLRGKLFWMKAIEQRAQERTRDE